MLLLRWRWPILILLACGLGYGSKYYTIGGIEHLHLRPRHADNGTPLGQQRDANQTGWRSGATLGDPPSFGFSAPHTADAWRHEPSLNDKNASRTAEEVRFVAKNPATAAASVPLSSPIPVPPDFVDNSELHLTARNPNQAPFRPQSNSEQQQSLGRLSVATKRSNPSASYKLGNTHKSETIRIASFQTDNLNAAKLGSAAVAEAYVRILSQFDVVALQGVQSRNDALLIRLVELLNRSDREFDFLLGPQLGRSVAKHRFAFVFDTSTIETDFRELYTLNDPHDLLSYEPLVAWFRCKQAPVDRAFTFSLVSAQVDPNLSQREISLLPKLIEVLQSDGRNEDDWIFAGDVADRVPSILDLDRSIRLALPVTPTDLFGSRASDSIFFSAAATREFTGQSGVYDFLRKFNLSVEQASSISGHLPVWAEFSIFEGEASLLAP